MSDTDTKTRGRPRPQAVIDRDEAVFKIVASAGPTGITNEEISEQTGLERNETYLSVFRLRKEGRVSRLEEDSGRTRRWVKSS